MVFWLHSFIHSVSSAQLSWWTGVAKNIGLPLLQMLFGNLSSWKSGTISIFHSTTSYLLLRLSFWWVGLRVLFHPAPNHGVKVCLGVVPLEILSPWLPRPQAWWVGVLQKRQKCRRPETATRSRAFLPYHVLKLQLLLRGESYRIGGSNSYPKMWLHLQLS